MPITDDDMRAAMTTIRAYSLVILRAGPEHEAEGARAIIWEHGRRNFELREQGLLSIVCPISGSGEVRGVGIFSTDEDETRAIMDADPGVQAGVFTYEVLPCRSFPGDALPA